MVHYLIVVQFELSQGGESGQVFDLFDQVPPQAQGLHAGQRLQVFNFGNFASCPIQRLRGNQPKLKCTPEPTGFILRKENI